MSAFSRMPVRIGPNWVSGIIRNGCPVSAVLHTSGENPREHANAGSREQRVLGQPMNWLVKVGRWGPANNGRCIRIFGTESLKNQVLVHTIATDLLSGDKSVAMDRAG